MDDTVIHRLEGAAGVVTLDTGARTLTFEHRGFGAFHWQKALSPLVIPIGAISAVQTDKRRFSWWFRVELRGRQPWHRDIASDPAGLICSSDPAEFVDRLRDVVGVAEPMSDAQVKATVPDFGVAESAPATPSTGGRIAGAVARGLINGFFNSR